MLSGAPHASERPLSPPTPHSTRCDRSFKTANLSNPALWPTLRADFHGMLDRVDFRR